MKQDRSHSLVALLRDRAAETPDRGYTWLAQGEEIADRLTYAGLDVRARAIAAALADAVGPGERAILLHPPGLDFIAAFFGCLYAGVIAVPAYPPRSRRADPRLRSIVMDCRPRAVLTTAALLARREALVEQIPELVSALWLDTEGPSPPARGSNPWLPRKSDPSRDRDGVPSGTTFSEASQGFATPGSDIAFLQYTSGSTGTPKGVMVTHANLLDNLEKIRVAFGQTPESVVVGWLPLFHDMGLIGNVLEPCYVGSECVLMSPAAFLQKPARWLEAIDRFRGTTSGGPNFAYDLCVRSIGSEVREKLDLSSWSVAFNGAEPVRRDTLDRFAETFAPCGFRRESFAPCYGLAEATLLVTAARGASDEPLVSCGSPPDGGEVRIVDGEVWLGGPSVAAGYWNRPEETRETFGAVVPGEGQEGSGPYLRTGDLGFFRDGELVITGRLKDLIILRGRNLYPQDLELTAEQAHPALRSGGSAAFSIEERGEEQLILACEVERHPGDLSVIADAVCRAVAEEHGVRVAGVALLRTGTIPKTSSGKIRRRECRSRYLDGTLEVLHRGTDRTATALIDWLREGIARRAGGSSAPIDSGTVIAATGLDSLALIALQGRLEEDLGLVLPAASLAELTIAELCDRLLEAGAGSEDRPPVVAGEVLGEHPVSPGQEALWLLERSTATEGVLHIAAAARLGSESDGTALLRAAHTLSARHPALRTTFSEIDGGLRQQVHASLPPDLAEEAVEDLDDALRSGARRRFDLSTEAPLRIRVFVGPDGERVLLLVLHHLVGDFWSLAVLLRDWAALYAEVSGHNARSRSVPPPDLTPDPSPIAPPPPGRGAPPPLPRVHAVHVEASLPPLPVEGGAMGEGGRGGEVGRAEASATMTYTDFVRWQQRLLAGPAGERLERFWLDRLHDAPFVLDLPTDRPRPKVAAHAGALAGRRLDPGLSGRVRELARGHKATLFTTLLATFQALLGRLSGQDDLLVGSPATLRRDRAFDGVVGYFVNPVVLRAGLAGDQTFSAYLEETRRSVALALEHRDFPFPWIARRLQPERDPGRPPIFQAMFVFQSTAPGQETGLPGFAVGSAGSRIEIGGLALESLPLDPGTAQLDLTLFAAEAGDALVLSCEHDTALFDGVTIERWLEHLETLLDAATSRPEARLGELPLLGTAERHQLLVEWSDTAVSPAQETACLHELFEAQARRTPEAVALIDGTREILYRDLDREAERLADRLRRRGAGPEVIVGVQRERTAEMVVALLAILKAGAAYLPLDLRLPQARRETVIAEARAALVLDQEEVSNVETPRGASPGRQQESVGQEQRSGARPWGHRAPTDEAWKSVAASETPHGASLHWGEGPGGEVHPENLAYVLYTSGSTGTPKGVAITHRSAVELVRWAGGAFSREELAGVLAATSLSFDLSVFEIFVPLSLGGMVILARDVLELPSLPSRDRVTLINTVPSAMSELVRDGSLGASVRTVNLAGESLPRSLADRLYATGTVERVWNLYGPSEDTTYSTASLVGRGNPREPGIGRPISSTKARVLAPGGGMEPQPPGAPGELYLGGAGLARGYLYRPDLTAERFVPDPTPEEAGARLYRTGDLVRWRPDGILEFLGRLDHQVKVRGFRIELGEIEAVLLALAGVREAVVVARREGLAAYYVPEPGQPRGLPLRDLLRERLPDYMVPGAFVALVALPRTPSGKVDRRALPEPEERSTGDDQVAPRTPVEEILAGIWSELLGVERVGANAHFFDLGGHSLLATRVTSRLRAALGVEMPLQIFFEVPVLADFAARVEELLRTGADLTAPPLVPVPRDEPLPLSSAQQRLWLIDQLDPGSPLYNMPGAVRIEGPLNVAVLARCLGEIVQRHEALRTVFAVRHGAPVQVIQPPAPFFLPVVDVAGLPVLPAWLAEEAARPFDLAHGPLLRVSLLRLAENDHVLAVTLHHIVSDGWSVGILIRELAALYPVFAGGGESPLPELPVQYADFAVWQRAWLAGETLKREVAFWREQLAGLPPRLDLPMDRPRPTKQSFRGASRPVRLPAGLVRQAEALSRSTGATLFMVLLAGFEALLARISGQDDLAVGSPVAGRNRVEIEGLIGFFVNTLVLRGDLSNAPSLRELLGRVRETALAAWHHQDVPFEKLVEELAPERSLAHSPLIQVMLVLQNAPVERLEIPGLRLRRMDTPVATAKLDLTLVLEEHEGELAGAVEYASDLFDPSTIDRLIGHYERLLTGGLADPNRPLQDQPLLAEAELHQLRIEWNSYEPPPALSVIEKFESWVDRTPDALALESPEEVLTYAALDARSNRLAHRLRALGVTIDARVGLCAERSPAMIVGLLAILKAGGGYVPLDPAYPKERLAFMVEDARLPWLLTEERLLGCLPETSAAIVLLDEPDPGCEGVSRLPGLATPDSLAYLIYTSGSTGKPKGTMIHHRGWSNLAEAQRNLLGVQPEDRVLQLASLSFDASASEIAMALASGATLVLGPRERQLSGRDLTALLETGNVVTLPPALLATLEPDELPGVETIIVAGEACPLDLVRRWAPGRKIINGYGPTEVTIGAAMKIYDGGERLPIGLPLRGKQVHVLDARGNLLPIGVAGELCVGGTGLARGYLGRPDRTAESFVPHPLATFPGERLYRTGDLALRRPDGEIEFLGRLDHQVKVRGFRVEPGEIEAVLVAIPGVREAAVVALQDVTGARLVAYYVAESGQPQGLPLRNLLREQLPDYMMPAAFVKLEALPVTPNGKVDRKALPAPDRQSTEEDHVAPRTPVEEVLAGIWAELLGLERVGANDHFFDLGGHSLLAARVTSRIRSLFGIEMPLRDLFEAPRLADLAARIEEMLRAGGSLPVPPLTSVPREEPLPLSFAQQRLWFIDQLEPGSPLYNIPAALRIQGPLDPEVLARCLGEIVCRHEALRTVFASRDGAPVQVIQSPAPFVLPVIDLAGLSDGADLLAWEAHRPFDLTRGPLLRGFLLRLARNDHVFALTLHHIVSDGWSAGVLVREVAALYAGSPLPELPVQYADFAVWQRSVLRGEVLDREISFWRRQLAGLPPRLELPTDRPRPGVQSFRGASRPVRLPADLARGISALGRREGATLFMVLLAGFQALLARISGQDDLAVGSPVAGRNRVEIEGLIGFFVNTLVLRGDLSGEPSFRELLSRVRETTLAAHAHQDLPFERLVEELAPERSLAYTPLFQAMLVLQNAPLEDLAIRDLHLRPVRSPSVMAKFDLTVSLAEAANGEILGSVEYATDLFDATTIDHLIFHYQRLLEVALAAPESPVSELPLLSPAERHQMVAEWNDTSTPPRPATLQGLLADRAAQVPDLPALVQGSEWLTHGELDARSDRLAAHLRALGVGPDVLVALFLERSIDLVVALLAVLKAGGAYLPLEATLPRPRLSFMLDDARAPLLLTRTRLLPILPEHSSRVVCLDDLPESAAGASSAGQPAADNLAYVLYTSGSTGRPKGVAVTHRGLSNYLLWAADAYPAGEGRGAPVHSPIGFDLTVTSLFLPLLAGRCVVLVPEGEGIEGLATALAEGGFGLVKLTPAHLDLLSQMLPAGRVPGCAGAFVIGGEPLSGEQLAFWRVHSPGLRLINEYGPTETVVGCCAWEVPAGAVRTGPVSIGRPIANTRIQILDPRLHPVPIGVPGDLHVGGAGVCRGYLHRPDLTAERFGPDPFGRAGERLYRTGDLARYLPDGTIELLGRLDHQVKIRGFRIELGEIETALAAVAGVGESVVMAREDAPGDRRLVAYYVAEPGQPQGLPLRNLLREQLPDYMVPAAFIKLEALPLDPHGKVDRKALPAPEWQGVGEGHVAPRTPVEEVLAGIWAELLGLERVGATDHFFDLGGHSLLATQVTSRLRSAFGIEMPLRDLFEAPRLADLAARIEAMLRAGTSSSAPSLTAEPREGPLPLSFAQQRLWFIDQLEPGSPLYNIPAALRIEGPLDPAVLARCLGEIVRRHEALRTVFAARDGVPEQVIQPPAPFFLSVIDLSDLSDLPFDLARGPLLRAVLLRRAENDHVFALTMHHIVSDGWSAGILLRELTALYPAFAEGKPSPLPELPVQYGDFAVWQRGWLQGEVLENEIAFWRAQLAGLPPLLELPTDRPRPMVQSLRGITQTMRLPDGLVRQMSAQSRREGATLYMLLLAGFQALLARYSGQDDLAVGSPVAGRNRVEIEGLIGFFVNTLVLRKGSGSSFRELIAQARETALAAWRHQDVPFEKLVEELAPERSLAHAPLFQAMLALQNAPLGSLEIGELRLHPLSRAGTTAKFDLTLSFEERGGELAGTAEYATDLFDPPTIHRLLAGFERLLAGALADADRSMADLPLLSEAELHQVRIEWNPAGIVDGIMPEASVVETFEGWADRTPDAIALLTVTAPGEALSYAELDRRANRLARRLRALGVMGDSRVGLFAERSPAMIVAVLGILKAGAAYVPLDPSHPKERLAFLSEDAGLSVLLTEERLLVLLGSDEPTDWNEERLPALATPDSLAYVIYTSGSTGRPKGAMIHHRGWSNLADAQRGLFGLGTGDRVLQFASLGFDASVWEISLAFGAGATLVLGPRERRLSREELTSLLQESTTALLPPPVLSTLLPDDLPGLATLIVGGEACPVDLAQVWAAGRRLWNAYGPTEASVVSTIHPYDGGDRLPIGRPIARMQAHVLDARWNPVPLGVAGELCLSGPGLAWGYLNRPDRTAASFVPHPIAEWPGERMYRTGDLARRLPDGSLDFLGRLDHQVKVRGFRIELGEIEAALMALPGIREAVVVIREENGDRRLVAYYATESGQPQGLPLRNLLREQLPDYMVPAAFVVLDALPLTPNGKVDRKALPAPDGLSLAEYQAPRTPVEEVLAGIWGEVLGLERVGASDRFFDLGGHSLLATRVLSRIREAFRVELPLRDLFEAPVLSDLAARIEEAGGGGTVPPLVPLSQDRREGLLPLSFTQERFWFLDRLEPGNPVYNMPGAYELAGPLDVAALGAALDHVASRHEVLRTVFRVVDGAPRQHILPSLPARLPVLDLTGLPEAVRCTEAKRLAAEHALHRFDLAQGPLLAAALLRLDPDHHHFLLVLHHAVCDGWSLPLFVREIGETYAACRAVRPPSLDRLPVQYADFAVWQRELVAAAGNAELSWWQERLAGEIAPLDLPTDRPRPAVQTWRGGRTSLAFPSGFVARLTAFGRGQGATLFMTLLAAIQALLHRQSGQHDILVGAPVAGRRAVETEGLIGCFLNTLVLRTDLGGLPSFRELVARVREVTLGAYSHQDVPFEAILASLPQPRDLSRTPVFQVMVNLLNLPSTEMRLPGLSVESLEEVAPLSKFDMTFYVREEDGLHVELVYNSDLFDTVRMEGLLAQLETFLDQALDRPEEAIGAFSLVTPGLSLPDPTEPLPATWSGAVHERFAARARQHPERPAATDRDGVWSYGDLETAANGLSAWLQARGILPGDRVAIYAHRSAPLTQALLGVLKAGAAFTVLDPAYPAARLLAILDAAAPRAFLYLEAAGELPAPVEDWLRDSGCPHLALSRVSVPASETGDLPRHTASPDDLAWVSFTSGSTGMPKGVLGSHRPLSHFIDWHSGRFGLAETDRFSLLSGLAHDPLLRDVFTPLCLGALLAIPEPEDLTTPDRLARWMREQGVTVAHLTPALSEVLTESREEPLESLRFAFFGGDVLRRHTVERLLEMAPGCACVNYYGATETPQGMGFHEVSVPDRERIPVGRGIDGVQLLVLNAEDRLAGVGELGEICIRTPYLAQGYLHDEVLTRERFVVNPFSGEPDDRVYRTGDLGRYLPDGSVDLQGRRDTQVKIRGFRIELGEIEAALSALPGVSQAVAVAREGKLVAYVAGEAAGEDLRRSLRTSLPDFMIPAAFVVLDALPLTPNGKVDRKALPAPEGPPLAAYQAPRTPVEEVLAGIWGEVLGIERIGIADRFFDLGGHSLLATQVLSRVRAAFGIELPLRDLFEAPALADLAARVEETLQENAGSMAPPLVPVSRDGELPLSFAQQRLWFFDKLDPESSLYNMQVALRIEGPLDAAVLVRALGEIVRRHEVLRTVFAVSEGWDGAPVQVIRPAEPFVLPLVDLAGAEEDAARPFDLARGPVLRGTLQRLAEEDHVLTLSLHHIAGDAWSLGLLVQELTVLYTAFAEGRPSPLAELPVQYADFAVWQSAWLRGEALEERLSYWRSQLAGLPPLLELPLDRPRPTVQSYRGASRPLRLPAEVTAQIRALAQGRGATLFMVLLAGFQTLLARYSGQQDLAVGSPVAGRSRVEVEGLIGLFVNMLVLRGDLSGHPSFRELLGRSRETALAAYLHQDVPFEMLVQELSPERSLSHSPLFQVALTLQNAPVRRIETGNLRVQPVNGSTSMAKFDLEMILQEHEGRLEGTVEYATDLYDAVTIDRLIVHFEKLLTAALAAPEQAALELPLLAPAERWQALHEWNDSERACPKDSSLHDLFAEQSARTPDAVAVSFENHCLTYRELDEQADRLARWLIDRGVGLDVLVALLVDRSVEMIVALIGILKAGGAYAPLEPGMPSSRLRWLLDDLRSPVLLTQTALLPEIEAAGGYEGPVLLLDGEPLEGLALGAPVPSHPLQLAYVNYTSGSTGKPKGVIVPHLGVTRLVMNPDYMELGPEDVILQLSTYAWDAATWEIWGALLNGGRLMMIPAATVLDFHRLARVLVEEQMTTIYLTTALFNQFVEQEGESLAGLSTLIIGGETASVPHFQKAVEILPDTRIINEYGPTENTSYSSWQLVRGTPEQGALPIGKPLSNSTVYVLDRKLQPMPLGLPGELFLGGDGLARGYLRRPDLTAERFVPHPFMAGERLYRTGDLGAWRPDGTLDFLGRMDFQVKIRGHRIEPAEVEDAIKRHEGVEDVLVMAWEPVPQDRRLVAYVVGDLSIDALRQDLRERLPDYMVPASFVALSALPLALNGKVDRKALPPPEQQGSAESYVAPLTNMEKIIAGIWSELLGVERVGVTDDFFDLGGHSLLAVRLMARIEQFFGVKLPLATLFEAPTVKALAKTIEGDPVWRSTLVRLHPGGSGRPVFLVHAAGGDVFSYVDLAKKLGVMRPVYGLQAVAEDAPQPTLEDLAARYLAVVREVQPEGPWLLAGWSGGAIIAYEMARQAGRVRGESSLVTMFDPQPPPTGRGLDITSLLVGFAALGGVHSQQKLEAVRGALEGLDFETGLDRVLELARAEGLLPPGVDRSWMRERYELYSRTVIAVESYVPGPYEGEVILFRASASMPPGATDLTAGWGLLARTEAHLIPDTNHFTLLQMPALDQLVEHLERTS